MDLRHEFPEIQGTLVIGIGHKARHGKDTVARFIHEAYPHLTRIYHFADPLKAYCRVARGMTIKDGPLLQRVGTDEFRATDPYVWVRALYWQIYEERPPVAIIPDTRFRNEAEFIRALNGKCICVRRVNGRGVPYVTADRDPNHSSECDLDTWTDWDYVINNVEGSPALTRQLTLNIFRGDILDSLLLS